MTSMVVLKEEEEDVAFPAACEDEVMVAWAADLEDAASRLDWIDAETENG